MRTARAIAVAAALAAATVGPATAAPDAHADLGLPRLLTFSPREQSDGVTAAALSADGRYVVFAGSLGGVKGILRRDLRTGAVEPVAAGDAYTMTPLVQTAADPSVSADGRYVSFTTSAALDPADDVNAAPDVYVRDMAVPAPAGGAPCDPAGGACAYTLASAVDGGAAGLAYATPGKGSAAAPRQAISADGRRVAFVTTAESDLAGPGTPAGQVAVRDLDARRTTLVSARRDPATGAMTGRPVDGPAVTPGTAAAISADGTTVAWSGRRIGDQAPTAAGDPAATTDPYNEPLWRRIADGPSAPTRRVAGAGDPEAPGCPPGGSIALAACQGPYPNLGDNANPELGAQGGWVPTPSALLALPSLSADGRTVAFLGSPPIPPQNATTADVDLFVADMGAELPRRAAVRRLTQDLGGETLSDLALSADGRRIAFATVRTTFALTPPFYLGPTPPVVADLPELYLVDLDGQSLRRVSRTVDGGPSTDGHPGGTNPFAPSYPSFDATGHMVAWVTPAANLVAVDANQAADAFLVEDRVPPAGVPGRVDIAPPPAPRTIPRTWRLALRAVARRDGTVRLDATVPGAGVLRATATATVPVTRHVKVRRRGGGRRTVTRRVLARRQVAKASLVARGPGLWRLTVRVAKAYRSLVRGRAGLDASAKVTFAAPARATLRDALDVRFRAASGTSKKTTKKPAAAEQRKTTKNGKGRR
jgi:hypothetical protein